MPRKCSPFPAADAADDAAFRRARRAVAEMGVSWQ